jgi:hypothetical protein
MLNKIVLSLHDIELIFMFGIATLLAWLYFIIVLFTGRKVTTNLTVMGISLSVKVSKREDVDPAKEE